MARIRGSVLQVVLEKGVAVRPTSGTLVTRRDKRKTASGVHLGQLCDRQTSSQDLDILLNMDDDFEVDGLAAPAQVVFDSVRAKLLLESDVFWARSSIGGELLDLWLETYQTSRSFRKRGIVELELR